MDHVIGVKQNQRKKLSMTEKKTGGWANWVADLVEELWGLEVRGSGKVENFLSKFLGLWVSSDRKLTRITNL